MFPFLSNILSVSFFNVVIWLQDFFNWRDIHVITFNKGHFPWGKGMDGNVIWSDWWTLHKHRPTSRLPIQEIMPYVCEISNACRKTQTWTWAVLVCRPDVSFGPAARGLIIPHRWSLGAWHSVWHWSWRRRKSGLFRNSFSLRAVCVSLGRLSAPNSLQK